MDTHGGCPEACERLGLEWGLDLEALPRALLRETVQCPSSTPEPELLLWLRQILESWQQEGPPPCGQSLFCLAGAVGSGQHLAVLASLTFSTGLEARPRVPWG